jgi:hypothetical protein
MLTDVEFRNGERNFFLLSQVGFFLANSPLIIKAKIQNLQNDA